VNLVILLPVHLVADPHRAPRLEDTLEDSADALIHAGHDVQSRDLEMVSADSLDQWGLPAAPAEGLLASEVRGVGLSDFYLEGAANLEEVERMRNLYHQKLQLHQIPLDL
jgi:hypothetical protein